MSLTPADTMLDVVMKLDTEELRKRIKNTDAIQYAAFLNYQNDFYNLMEVVEEDNVTNGRKKKTGGNKERERKVDKNSIINAWAFTTSCQQAIRTNVNDPTHADYNQRHKYFGKEAIGKRPDDVPKAGWENPSIMPLMKKMFAENKEQIILDMINEKDVFTSDNKDRKTYWSQKSITAKNSYIEKIKKEYPDNTRIQELQLLEEPINEEPTNNTKAPTTAAVGEIVVDPSTEKKIKDQPANEERATRTSRRRPRDTSAPNAQEEDAKAPRTEQNTTPKRTTRASAAAKNPAEDNVTAESTEEEDQPGSQGTKSVQPDELDYEAEEAEFGFEM